MQNTLFKFFLIIKALKKNQYFLLFSLIFIAIFCLPIIASWANYEADSTSFFSKLQYWVSNNNKHAPIIMKTYVTAYSSNEDETDDSPCIAASGYNLCQHNVENIVATNFLPFGTKIKFPQLDPDKIYIVEDRMNKRFFEQFDIWLVNKEKARQFGRKYLTVEIYND